MTNGLIVKNWLDDAHMNLQEFARWSNLPEEDLQRWAAGTDEPPEEVRKRVNDWVLHRALQLSRVPPFAEANRIAAQRNRSAVKGSATPGGGSVLTDGRSVYVIPPRR